jgi:hypothetical protein
MVWRKALNLRIERDIRFWVAARLIRMYIAGCKKLIDEVNHLEPLENIGKAGDYIILQLDVGNVQSCSTSVENSGRRGSVNRGRLDGYIPR